MIDGFVELDDELTVHYQRAGRGDTVILLVPGWTMSSRVFEHQFSYFDQSEEFQFISFDPRAHGLSSKTAKGHHYPQHGRDLHVFINALELDGLVLGGWSFGCLSTLAYIHQFGAGRLGGFIMLDGPPRAAAEDNVRDWATYRFDDADGLQQFYSQGRLQDPEASNREFAAWMLENETADNIRWVLEITAKTPDTVAAMLNESSIDLDYRQELKGLDGCMPVCYLMRADRVQSVRRWAATNTPSAEVVGFGEHLMFWERPQQFNEVLSEFARRCQC